MVHSSPSSKEETKKRTAADNMERGFIIFTAAAAKNRITAHTGYSSKVSIINVEIDERCPFR